MKKIVLIICIIIVIAIVGYIAINHKDAEKENNNLNEIFKEGYCYESTQHIVTNDLVRHICKLCNKDFQDSSMVLDICNKCSKETNRCQVCGKEIKE